MGPITTVAQRAHIRQLKLDQYFAWELDQSRGPRQLSFGRNKTLLSQSNPAKSIRQLWLFLLQNILSLKGFLLSLQRRERRQAMLFFFDPTWGCLQPPASSHQTAAWCREKVPSLPSFSWCLTLLLKLDHFHSFFILRKTEQGHFYHQTPCSVYSSYPPKTLPIEPRKKGKKKRKKPWKLPWSSGESKTRTLLRVHFLMSPFGCVFRGPSERTTFFFFFTGLAFFNA